MSISFLLYNLLVGTKRHSLDIKSKAAILRAMGRTYAEIRQEVHVSKSTLSLWLGEKFKEVFDRKAQLTHLKRARVLATETIRRRKAERDFLSAERGQTVAKALRIDDVNLLKSLLAMLYWAEGAKAGKQNILKFVNTDPRLLQLYITLLRRCFAIDEKRLRARLHLHYYHDRKKSLRYWSRLLRVPSSQFGKIYIKKRSETKKFRENFMGICFISYGDTRIVKEVLATAYEIHSTVS